MWPRSVHIIFCCCCLCAVSTSCFVSMKSISRNSSSYTPTHPFLRLSVQWELKNLSPLFFLPSSVHIQSHSEQISRAYTDIILLQASLRRGGTQSVQLSSRDLNKKESSCSSGSLADTALYTEDDVVRVHLLIMTYHTKTRLLSETLSRSKWSQIL